MNTNLLDDERTALAQFFRIHFYGDQLEHPADLDEAIADYLDSSKDSDGVILRAGVNKLLGANYSEEDITKLAEKEWQSAGNSAAFGYTYKDVLSQMLNKLSK